MPSHLIKEGEAALRLGISVATLRTYRSTRRIVIPYIKISKSVLYDPEQIQKFIEENTIGGTE